MLAFHTVFGIAALVTGFAVLFLRKGTARHRQVGWAYGAAMYGLCLSSFGVPADILAFVDVAGMTYGIFHVFAFWGAGQLTAGLYIMVRRERFEAPVKWHLYNMLWSFVGLLMATGSHFFRYLVPWMANTVGLSVGWSFGVTALLMWALPAVVGTVWIERWKARYDAAPDAMADPATA